MGFALTIAIRFLREGRFQSLLIIVGVAAGVAVVTYISALVEGLQGNTSNRSRKSRSPVWLRDPANSWRVIFSRVHSDRAPLITGARSPQKSPLHLELLL